MFRFVFFFIPKVKDHYSDALSSKLIDEEERRGEEVS